MIKQPLIVFQAAGAVAARQSSLLLPVQSGTLSARTFATSINAQQQLTSRISPTSSTSSHVAPIQNTSEGPQTEEKAPAPEKKTVAQSDEDLRLRLEAMSGDGGSAGVEYENGVARGLKREVKRNMFRLI